jgi:competence protein ComEA
MTDSNRLPEVPSERQTPTGAGAAAAPAHSALRPLIVRALIGAIAILGLSGIGAASMLAGLEGAHASPPEATSTWLAAGSASASAQSGTTTANTPPTVPSAAAPTTDIATTPTCPTKTEDGKIILNRAGAEDLRKIPGIGPKRAEAILALRTKLKRFRRPAELLRVKGIGPKSLLRMQPHFVLDDPKNKDCEPVTKTAHP